MPIVAGRWLLRYLPAELLGTATALASGLLAHAATGSLAVAALAGALGENIGFYGYFAAVEARRHLATAAPGPRWRLRLRVAARTARDLVVEFGPAEAADSLLVRPSLMYLGPLLVPQLAAGLVVGKVGADIVFYLLAAACLALRRRWLDPSPAVERSPFVPPTPYLTLDLDAVDAAYRRLSAALPDTAIYYAMKCNPHPALLRRIAGLGGAFEVASAAELDQLVAIGIDPPDVLFSNPVKPPAHIAHAWARGLDRFAFDSVAELDKLATHAPGARVYVRLAVPRSASAVASEGKFGVDVATAADLLRDARRRGLSPHGVAFHVGSQMLDPEPWAQAIKECGELMRELDRDGIRLTMLNLGGGFPVGYQDPAPDIAWFGDRISAAIATLLPYPVRLVAEPGRHLAAEAGTLTTTVIGVARRGAATWLHLDVGAFNGLMEALETGNQLRYPVTDSRASAARLFYHLTGPTCDSQDTILYDVELSADLTVGDTVFIGSTGAYTTAYASAFNGFDVPSVHIS
ncbi:type III PLP-dependent enzyme [Pilimelia columellifera]